jgi:glycosyltransferase involved in cell wall biosynthesis
MKESDARGCSVIVPVFGDGHQLVTLASKLDEALGSSGYKKIELILVDDCGPGNAWQEICRLSAERPHTMGIQLMRNFGQHNAIMCGLRYATGDIVVTIDDDLQNDPASIPSMIAKLDSATLDVVYGVPDVRQHGAGRNLGSRLVNMFYRRVFGIPVTVTPFRVIRREIVEAVLRYDLNFTFIDGLLAWNTTRIGMQHVTHHPRVYGKSGYTIGKLLTLAMNVFTNFSLLPLQIVSLLGLLFSAIGFVMGLWVLVSSLLSRIQVPGYASIIVAIFVLGGVQLLSLGMIGEYLGRLHMNVNRKPQYTVRRTTEENADSANQNSRS